MYRLEPLTVGLSVGLGNYMRKVAFVLFDDPRSLTDSIRAAHALHYAVSMKRKGIEAVVYLEGPSTAIPVAAEQSPYPGLKDALREALAEGVILGACGYCASPGHVGVKDELIRRGLRLIGDLSHHEDLSFLLEQGYEVIVM